MVVIAGYREAEYFADLLQGIREELLALLKTYWIINPQGQDKFFQMLPDLLHGFCERMDEELGIKAEDSLKRKLAKLPFTFFEYPQQYIQVYSAIISMLLNNMNQPYDAQRLFKWPREKFIQIYQQILKALVNSNVILHRVILDPQMPDFLKDLIKMQIQHLNFVQVITPETLEFPVKKLIKQIYPGFDILLTAPYSQTLINPISNNYTSKRSQQDNINVVKTHFAVKKIVDQQSLEVHIFRTPHSMDSESAKNKIDEFRKSPGDEGFQVLGGYVQIQEQLIQVSFVNLLWVTDSFYYNEWSSVCDYGLVEIMHKKKELEQAQVLSTEIQERITKLPLGYKNMQTRGMATGWSDVILQRIQLLNNVKQVQIQIGQQQVELQTDFATEAHQNEIQDIYRQMQKNLTLPEQIRIVQKFTRSNYKLDFDEFMTQARDFVYNQNYDQIFDQWLKNQIIARGLQKQYNRTIAEVNGVKIDINDYIKQAGTQTFGIENEPRKGVAEEEEEILDFEQQFYNQLKDEIKISKQNYVVIRNAVVHRYRMQQQALLTALEIQKFVPLSYQQCHKLITVLEEAKMINQYVWEEQPIGPQVYSNQVPEENISAQIKQGNNEEVVINNPQLIDYMNLAKQPINFEKVEQIITNDQKMQLQLKMANAVVGRFE
ncbi:Conserved_hypothetical protein [Hexamita inflata]|uniref:Uncharacterized protein n=1 Tax=Hexamita inflata TaxID=28002 RepID=A0AA86Q473_9EUKA|nr:Conserved hypothetical protein [Hexamita inflata]